MPPAHVVSREICEIFESIYFTEHLRTVASEFQLTESLNMDLLSDLPANINLFKVDDRNTRKRYVRNVVLVFLLLTLNIFHNFF